MTILLAILCIMLILTILQLWLFTATMEAFLEGNNSITIPALIASIGCLALNLGLIRYLRALDS